MQQNIIKLFLRFAISVGFLSAVADRFGYWPKGSMVWGNWNSFLEYTQLINPLIPEALIPFLGAVATILEVVFAICLLIGFKTEFVAKLSGFLMLSFALAMTFSTGVKGALDFSVYTASAASFALSLMKNKYYEIDTVFNN